MIVVRVEMWPRGNSKAARMLALGVIANDGTGSADVGHYAATFSPQINVPLDEFTRDCLGKGWPGEVRYFERRKRDVWQLLHQALGDSLRRRFPKAGATPATRTLWEDSQ